LGIPLQLPTPIQAGPPLLLPLCVSCLQAALQAGKVPAQVCKGWECGAIY